MSTVVVTAGGGPAGAAQPNAQAVGRMLDGAAGGMPIEKIVDLKDARATAPGTTSAQNPLDVTLGGQGTIPLTGAISIPTAPAVDAGAVNQVAAANLNGASLGASGAIANDGGVNLGDNGSGEPTAASINLTDAALNGAGGSVPVPGLPTIPGLPGTTGATKPVLGGITGAVHGVFARAATDVGGDVQTPQSGVADVDLSIGSPALAALIKQLQTIFTGDFSDLPISAITDPTGLTDQLKTILGSASTLGDILKTVSASAGKDCALTDPTASDLDFGNGVVISSKNASINISLQKMIETLLDKDISNLDTSNFDLVSFLVENLPKILSDGLSAFVTSITTKLNDQFKECTADIPGLGSAAATVSDQLAAGQKQFVDAIKMVSAPLATAGASGLKQLADGLKNVIDIGLNVQYGPGQEPIDDDYPFTSDLAPTPDQATDPVQNQSVVRAIEINLLNTAAAGNLGTNSSRVTQLAGNAAAARPLAAPGGAGTAGLTVALANAAAGPSVAPAAVASTTAPPTVEAATNIPTAVPAGRAGGATGGGAPLLPLLAILALMIVSGGSLLHLRQRGPRHG